MGKNLKGKEIGDGIYQQKDGFYCARFVDKLGKRITKRFKDGHNENKAYYGV